MNMPPARGYAVLKNANKSQETVELVAVIVYA